MWQRMLWLAAMGSLGTVCRYWVDMLVTTRFGTKFPWGILVVNAAGCFIFGLVYSIAEHRLPASEEARLIILTGFVGAFTTYSTFAFQTAWLLRDAQWLLAGVNIVSQIALGLVGIFLGIALGRRF